MGGLTAAVVYLVSIDSSGHDYWRDLFPIGAQNAAASILVVVAAVVQRLRMRVALLMLGASVLIAWGAAAPSLAFLLPGLIGVVEAARTAFRTTGRTVVALAVTAAVVALASVWLRLLVTVY